MTVIFGTAGANNTFVERIQVHIQFNGILLLDLESVNLDVRPSDVDSAVTNNQADRGVLDFFRLKQRRARVCEQGGTMRLALVSGRVLSDDHPTVSVSVLTNIDIADYRPNYLASQQNASS